MDNQPYFLQIIQINLHSWHVLFFSKLYTSLFSLRNVYTVYIYMYILFYFYVCVFAVHSEKVSGPNEVFFREVFFTHHSQLS